MSDVIGTVSGWVWSPALVYLCLGAGLYFSIRTRLVQVRQIPQMVSQLFSGGTSASGVSSFQALTMSLAGRVGAGNIVGVATAIGFGGPGAVFWMWMVAFLGASTSFIECTLGQIYKEKDAQGLYRGGPAYYIEKVSAGYPSWAKLGRVYAIVFAGVAVIAMGLLLPGVQASSISGAAVGAWSIPDYTVAIALVIVLAFIIVGGVKRIAKFAEVVVPFMAAGYILIALVVMALNFEVLGDVITLIFKSAFGLQAGYGAIIGLAVEWGVKRGIYSNEAGQGTGPHAAAAAEVSHPARQGFVQAFAVYIDTLFVCSATAFIILSTGFYNVYEGSVDGKRLDSGPDLGLAPDTAAYTQGAVDSVWSGFGPTFVAIALGFFAFTTVVAYYYMAETNLTYLMRNHQMSSASSVLVRLLQLAILVSVAYGAMAQADVAWALGDTGVGLMAWLNIVAILIIAGPALKALRDFERQHKEGLDPVFDPRALGIKNATFWERRLEQPQR